MRRITIALWCFSGAIAFSSCGSGEGNTEAGTENGTATVAGTDSTITDQNKELLAFAAQNAMLQVQLGQMAAKQGATDNVKAYGQQLVDWYNTKQKEVQDLSQQYGVTLPQQLESEQTEYLEEIRTAEANKFDEKYWESVIDAQKDAIEKFEDNLNDVEAADATAFTLWARNSEKELRAQMEQALAYQLELKNNEGGITESL
ncbi:DUF4142 domain-containing protein [Pontibacter akesuensis]|uniref:Putative membrane protein n=1 Tax=Pontibacter akesuensis TaxID=388950 RepID=A0A1I7K0U3_9BACT|nr:DUF4142 domain-containing protein [Pontibacter akesuensis]GHA75980.1 hypothetical protein GCM10007389_32380 [Pontibacter akesuensis]SFU91044.1 putative membrane protein [Pontibacter akesuensis]